MPHDMEEQMMSKTNNSGVYQLENGNWGYRFTLTENGHRRDIRRIKDNDGNVFTSKTAATRARSLALADYLDGQKKKQIKRKTVREIYQEYREKGSSGKAYTTLRKQDSLWNNHLNAQFGNRYCDELTSAEIKDYLSDLYYKHGFSFRYTEGFLKMFYLILGQAYSRDCLDVNCCNKLCVNKDTKIQMPKLRTDDDTDIKAYSSEQIEKLDEYFRGTNAETAYLLGRHCGLRINECYGLKWDNVDLENGTIFIDRQEQYQNGLIKLVRLKTKNARRTIYLNETMKTYLSTLAKKRTEDEKNLSSLRQQNQKFITDIDGKMISSTELVNCLPNGKIQTVNSMKFHSREIKRLGIADFKFHHLRHTYGTRLAEMNTPEYLLCNQMGHGKIETTHQYYIAISKNGIKTLQDNLNRL